jgi:uncharacterized repeat protein (TIGR04052 family)
LEDQMMNYRFALPFATCLLIAGRAPALDGIGAGGMCVCDAAGDGQVQVNELVTGVNNALSGCRVAPVTIHFEAVVGSEPFACGNLYSNIGTSQSDLIPADLRFYVHDLRLLTHDGEEVPVSLDQDGVWQVGSLALLDFEDGTPPCNFGTQQTNTTIRGLAPEQEYKGLRFRLGVPFGMNHQNAATAPSPLNLTAMFWSWQAGYKFLRFDEARDVVRVHVGSTGCEYGHDREKVESCARPNRGEVILNGFDPRSDTVVVDVARLFSESDLTVNHPDTAPGCESAPVDTDCDPLFRQLGINFANGLPDPSRQTFFSVAHAGGGGHDHIMLGSDEPGGGRLTADFPYENHLHLSLAACLGGHGDDCEGGTAVYTGNAPFLQLGEDDEEHGRYALREGVPLSFEITAIDAAASVRFEETRIDTVGQSALIGVTAASPFHAHGELQLVLPGGEPPAEPHAMSFKVTTTAPEFSESVEHTLLMMAGGDDHGGHGDHGGNDDHGDHE